MVTTEEARIPIKQSNLVMARQRVALDQSEAVDHINRYLRNEGEAGVSVGDLTAWEAGEKAPTILQAEVLARTYLVSFVDLLQEELPGLPGLDFRRRVGSQEPLTYETLQRLEQFDRLYEVARRVFLATSALPTG